MLKFLFSRIPEDSAQPNILLIDDDRDICTVANLILLTQGVGNVLEAGTGREGIEIARPQRPDVIVLDMKLPDIGGETVLQLLRADPWTRHIPVILFTAFAGDPARLRALPVSDIVLKPFHAQRLCDVIRRALALRSDTGNVRMPLTTALARMAASTAAAGATA
jgi:two-component system KDP operon response regulator KdpE